MKSKTFINNKTDPITQYVPLWLQQYIEKHYYDKIDRKLRFEKIIHDPLFKKNPIDHIALYSDHGVVHARDVTICIPFILNTINGVLIPYRELLRIQFMIHLTSILAFIHDIGMSNCSLFGRITHAEFIAHEAFTSRFDPIIDRLWQENTGNIAWRILNLVHEGVFNQPPKMIFREILALAYCHSKRSVDSSSINSPSKLRLKLQNCLLQTLKNIHVIKTTGKTPYKTIVSKNRESLLKKYYKDFDRDSFAWLLSNHHKSKLFIEDIVDSLRVLHSADALRQRGTRLKTSSGYQIFFDSNTAKVIYAIKNSKQQIFLLETDRKINAGEANLESADFTPEGNLAFRFHQENFPNSSVKNYAIRCLKTVVEDVYADVNGSFNKPSSSKKQMAIVLEKTSEHSDLIDCLAKELIKSTPTLAGFIKIVSCIKNTPEDENLRYLQGKEITWSTKKKRDCLRKIIQTGMRIRSGKFSEIFANSRLVILKKDEVLMRAGSHAGFVYVPLTKGLMGFPEGGYASFTVLPWQPLGTTGVIRGDIRNATVVSKKTVKVLIIPKETYLKYWHRVYKAKEFLKAIKQTN